MGVVVGSLILVQGVTTYRTYFHKWAVAPEIFQAYEVEWTDLARTLNAQPSAADMVYLIPSSHGYYSFEYLYQGVAPFHVFDMAQPGLAQKISSALAAMESVSLVKLVEWNTNTAWIDDDTEPFAFLLRKYGRYVGSDELADFRLHNYVDISLSRPWTFYDYLEPLTVHYDGGISLHGLALGQAGRAVVNSAAATPWEGIVLCGQSCNGRPPPGWISIMRFPCACTIWRAKGSTKRMMSYGNRRTIRLRASGRRMRWSSR